MIIKSREDSIDELDEVLSKEQLSVILSHNYSDKALSVMSEFDRGYIERFVNTLYDTESMEKIIDTYCKRLIDWKDMLHIVKYSCYDNSSKDYIDRFIESIENGEVSHLTASRLLAATANERNTYEGLMMLVNSGAYHASQFASIGLNYRVAEELRELGIPLTAMRKNGTFYDLTKKTELEEAVRNGDRIKTVKFPMLAVKLSQIMTYPDWHEFKEWFSRHTAIDRENLTSTDLEEKYRYFSMERYAKKLVSKVANEYNAFIEEVKRRKPEDIIKAAYELVIKEQIKVFMAEVPQLIPEDKTDALMSSGNTLNDIYEQWLKDDDFFDTDIEVIIENTADKIIADRVREQKLAAELAKRAVADDMQDKPRFKPFKRARR